jgi:dihydroneopterin triphosphate aldolase (PTPS-III) / 6-pyruvoyltetrahydropterin synthase
VIIETDRGQSLVVLLHNFVGNFVLYIYIFFMYSRYLSVIIQQLLTSNGSMGSIMLNTLIHLLEILGPFIPSHLFKDQQVIMGEFELLVNKSDFKFNIAHFIVHRNVRERMHGHNYQLSIRVVGDQGLCSDGYLMDFGEVKRQARKLCKEMNEYFICPEKSPYMDITEVDGSLCMNCSDGSKFVLPTQDCKILPLYHSSVEEMAHYFWCVLIE